MKKEMKFFSFLGLLVILFSFSFRASDTTKTIIIDAGHGGADAGAQFDGKHESEIVRNIANRIIQLNDQKNLSIILLRNTDEFIAIKDRVSKVNEIKPDFMISLHANASENTKLNGVGAVVSKENKYYNQSKDIAQNLINAVAGERLKEGKVWEGKSILLKESNCPAVTLEIGFLSNEADRDYITSKAGQDEIAKKILESLK